MSNLQHMTRDVNSRLQLLHILNMCIDCKYVYDATRFSKHYTHYFNNDHSNLVSNSGIEK